jgi:hypothetical protein
MILTGEEKRCEEYNETRYFNKPPAIPAEYQRELLINPLE